MSDQDDFHIQEEDFDNDAAYPAENMDQNQMSILR